MANDIPIIDSIDKDTALRFGIGGALTGASAAAVLNLAEMLKDLNDKRKAQSEPTETDENTIVLTIPKKAEDNSEVILDNDTEPKAPDACTPVKDKSEPLAGPCTKVTKEGPVVKSITMGKQVKHYDGKYGSRIKQANWQTLMAATLAAGGAGALGYTAVDKLYEMHKMKEKEQELERVKQEYLDLLRPKIEEELTVTDPAAGEGPSEEEAEDTEKTSADNGPTFNKIDYPLGMAALALLLGTGSTAWITKRMLDEHDHAADEKVKKPKLSRIVFKTAGDLKAPQTEEEKTAAEIATALIDIHLDICSGTTDIVGDTKVAECLSSTPYTAGDLYKMATSAGGSEDYQNLISTLEGNPDLRKTLERLGMEKHPILKYMKWSVGLPGISHLADNKLYSKVEEMFGNKPAQIGEETKAANISDSYMGSMLAAKILDGPAKPEKDEAPEEEETRDPEDVLKQLQIAAADDDSKKFITENADKLRNVLTLLAQQGKL